MRRFRGEAENKVDVKGRVSIPAAFRRILEEGDPDWSSGSNPNLVIVYGRRNRKCLEGYSLESIEIVGNSTNLLKISFLQLMQHHHHSGFHLLIILS